MANLGRKISGINSLQSFTSKVVYAASNRYGIKNEVVTFQAGREYSGKNFFKGSTKIPKLRILSIFQPLINGNPNTNNDTYVAFQIYDYTLNVWRGPFCKRNNPTDALTYVDYFITTIDSFGRKYGNQYTGSGSSVTTFTPPQVFLSTMVSTPINSSNGVIQINSDHNPSTFTLGGRDNKMYHFHGFITMDLYANGMWCFYSISANGQGVGFNHLLDTAPYNTNTYPNLLPNTNKFSSEWRVTTICNIFNNIGYSPRIRINNTGLGPIKYYTGPDPGIAFPANNVSPTEVWCTYDPGNASTFFLTPLWAPGGNEGESAQGVAGSGADQYAPAGWYGTSAENSYAYWDGFGNWSGYATYGGGTSYTKFLLLGPFGDPEMACSETADRVEYNTVFTDNVSTGPTTGKTVYGDSAGSSLANLIPMMWYKVFDENFNSLNYTITVDPGMIIDNQSSCR